MTQLIEQDAACTGTRRCDGHTGAAITGLVPLMGHLEALPAPLIYRKGWALLGYLAMESNRMHSRGALAALFWPTLAETSALTNLRQVLSNLNRFCCTVLGAGVLRIERSTVGLMRGAEPMFDIDLLRLAPCQSLPLLAGQPVFMSGMEDIADSNFQSWLEATRQALEAQMMGAAERCCDEMLDAARWEPAVQLAHALSQRDPWNEAHARRVMRAHAGSGMRTAAVKVYQRLETLLRRELSLDPGKETRQLLEQIGGPALNWESGLRSTG
ncbi:MULTISPECIES: BTAD domain-containing putative transcriptional regulator [Stenotrophomonas]|uniref:AfsR/SARP family transcriptional regulator n=1 Tax=Stenotrophomonas TaxID=40323 RepID=UPI0007706362|nr:MULTISPECIES: BTAD domain-containing putative transcriptional regulator [Stenotrophomonas]AMJ56166.1 hypothetical protein AXG53_05550 [Stenotrophomonas sp. KCTC 12332]